MPSTPMASRRDFVRLLSVGGSAALLTHPAFAELHAEARRLGVVPPPSPRDASDEARWAEVRARFLMPADLHLFNAANLCPSPEAVLRSLSDHTRRMDATPSPGVRTEMQKVKETTRRRVAECLRVTPEEIVITRNTSEANNFVSSGLDLGRQDEVIVFADNHPSNLAAWIEKGKRFGYAVTVVEQPSPHPGADYYVEAVRKRITPRTKVLAFSHVTNTVGDVVPARELCALAREHDILSLVDGAQTFGVADVNLRDIDPDFYSGSAHKWPCGPLEAGVLFVNARSQSRLWPTIISLYAGETGISKTLEGLGQRDEPAILAFGEAVAFQQQIGMRAIESRTRALAQQLLAGLGRIPGVELWTHPHPGRSATVVSFRPGTRDPVKLATQLFEAHGIVCAARGGSDRPGLRFSPHLYNSPDEIEQVLACIGDAGLQ